MNLFDIQLHQMSTALKKGDLHIPDIGDIVPASLMLHDIVDLRPVRCSYMNNWGCEHLGTSADEINTLGDSYYEKYFVREESLIIFEGMSDYIQGGDFDKQYNFFQRVKLHRHNEYIWFYTVCKIIQVKGEKSLDNKAILLSSPVMDMEKLISRISKTLEQDIYIQNNYHNFSKLTSREKEIVRMVANGKSTNDIADQLFISSHTVATHRKNIIKKLGCRSFAELVKFAIAFDLI